MSERPLDSKRPRKRQAMLLAMLPLLSLFLASGLLLSPTSSQAQSATRMGIDLLSDGNANAIVGGAQDCLEVEVGEQFPLDIYVENVLGLRAWELRLAFDHDLLQVMDHSFDEFLLSTNPSGTIFPSLFEMETADRYYLAAAEFRGTPDSGSGVLAHLSMQAVAPGRSPIGIVTGPSYIAPRLTDDTGSDVFEGELSQGEVAVGEACSASTPKSTPAPSSGSPSTSDDQGPISSPPALVSLTDSPVRTLADADGPTHSSNGATEDGGTGGSSDGGSESDPVDAPQASDPSADDSAPERGAAAPFGNEGSSGFGWREATVAALVFAILAGGALMALNLRRPL